MAVGRLPVRELRRGRAAARTARGVRGSVPGKPRRWRELRKKTGNVVAAHPAVADSFSS